MLNIMAVPQVQNDAMLEIDWRSVLELAVAATKLHAPEALKRARQRPTNSFLFHGGGSAAAATRVDVRALPPVAPVPRAGLLESPLCRSKAVLAKNFNDLSCVYKGSGPRRSLV